MPKYQLVIQFPDDYFESFDAMVEWEDKLIARLPKSAAHDGHDTGDGTINFFVYTDFPEAVTRVIRSRVMRRIEERWSRIAYRPVRGKTFVNLWPRRDPRPFSYSYKDEENPFTPHSKRKIAKRSAPGTRRPRI